MKAFFCGQILESVFGARRGEADRHGEADVPSGSIFPAVDSQGEPEGSGKRGGLIRWFSGGLQPKSAWCLLVALLCLGYVCAYDKGEYNCDHGYVNFTKIKDSIGLADAQYELGEVYEHGYGEKNDTCEALRLYKEAAERGDVKAQFYLGCLLCKLGREGRQNVDYDYVFELWERAADSGLAEAQFAMYQIRGLEMYGGHGWLSKKGRSLEEYRSYLESSAQQGLCYAQYELGCITNDVAQRRECFSKAYAQFKKLSKSQDVGERARGLFCLGKMHEHGYGNEAAEPPFSPDCPAQVSTSRAYMYYKEAAQLNHDGAMCAIGDLYAQALRKRSSSATDKSTYRVDWLKWAFPWYAKAAMNYNGTACKQLWAFYTACTVTASSLAEVQMYQTEMEKYIAHNWAVRSYVDVGIGVESGFIPL